jgi:hypothetical protein
MPSSLVSKQEASSESTGLLRTSLHTSAPTGVREPNHSEDPVIPSRGDQ